VDEDPAVRLSDTPLNREMLFGFGQRLYSKAKTFRNGAEKNDKALTREELLAESAAAFEHVLVWFPANEENDRVMLSLCSAYLEAGKFGLAEITARSAGSRFPKSRYLNTFDYTQAFALFAQKKFPRRWRSATSWRRSITARAGTRRRSGPRRC